jgi:hypothetical protein
MAVAVADLGLAMVVDMEAMELYVLSLGQVDHSPQLLQLVLLLQEHQML